MDFVDLASLDAQHIYLASVIMVTIAELGDKTQLLAMAFATRFSAWKVMLGVFLASILTHGLAVWVGAAISSFSACNSWIQLIAACMFIIFGLWTIKGEKPISEEKRPTRCGPVLTVLLAFFVAELGDKTQLATINIAVINSRFPLAILVGAVTGMLIVNILGIIVGTFLVKRISERVLSLISAGIFICFGLLSTSQVLLEDFGFKVNMVMGILSVVLVLVLLIGYCLIKKPFKFTRP